MEAGPAPARVARARHRHELRTLTYVTLDQANGGIVRNLTHDGIAVQAVAAVRPRQQLRVRFELRYPKLRVETRGEVVWSTFSGQCGIRFLDLSPRLLRQIDEWILGDLLQGLAIPWEQAGSVCIGSAPSVATSASRSVSASAGPAARSVAMARTFPVSEPMRPDPGEVEDRNAEDHESGGHESGDHEFGEHESEDDGLIVSPSPTKVIALRSPQAETVRLPAAASAVASAVSSATASAVPLPASHAPARVELDWLSQPLSGRSLAWTVNSLVVVAALLLSVLVFLSITRQAPKWPLTMATGGAIVIAALYWGFFRMFGGTSLGTRMARLAASDLDELEDPGSARFR